MDITEVARRADVSTATVSRVLNGSASVRTATAERVQRVMDELHYVPNTSARSLRRGRTRLLGLIVSDINNPFFPELIDDFEARARSEGIDVIFTHTNYDSDRLEHSIRRLIDRNVDGIAVLTSESSPRAFEFAAQRGRPFVLFNQEGARTRYNNIFVDHDAGAAEAIAHLHKLGHRKIGFISGTSQFDSTRARQRAFLQAMQQHKLRVRAEWTVEGNLHMDGGAAAMETLLACASRPSAVLSTNDVMAVGALQAAHRHGLRVPEDLSLIGFDNLPFCEMVTPALTSVDIPRRVIAAQAFRMLLQASRTPGRKLRTPVIATGLVVRKSTAGPASQPRG